MYVYYAPFIHIKRRWEKYNWNINNSSFGYLVVRCSPPRTRGKSGGIHERQADIANKGMNFRLLISHQREH